MRACGLTREKPCSPLWVYQLRRFGREGAECDEAFDGIEESGRGSEELQADLIAVECSERIGTDVLDLGFGHCWLTINNQLDGLNRLDRERLLSFDQRTSGAEVEYADWLADIEGAPEGSEDFESHSIAAVGR